MLILWCPVIPDTVGLMFDGVQLVIQSISRQVAIVFILVTEIGCGPFSYQWCPYLNLVKLFLYLKLSGSMQSLGHLLGEVSS